MSTSKDVLFCILNGTTIPKRERKTVEYDPINGYHLCGDRDKTFIWTRDEPKEKDKSYSMEKFFSLEYQLLSKRQGTKIKKPQFLIDRALEDNNEALDIRKEDLRWVLRDAQYSRILGPD